MLFIYSKTHKRCQRCTFFLISNDLRLNPVLYEFLCMFRQWPCPPSLWVHSCQSDAQPVCPQALHHLAMQCRWAGILPGESGLYRGQRLLKLRYCKETLGGKLLTCCLVVSNLPQIIHRRTCMVFSFILCQVTQQRQCFLLLLGVTMWEEAICVKCLIYLFTGCTLWLFITHNSSLNNRSEVLISQCLQPWQEKD